MPRYPGRVQCGPPSLSAPVNVLAEIVNGGKGGGGTTGSPSRDLRA